MATTVKPQFLYLVSFYYRLINRYHMFMTVSRIVFKPKLNFMFQTIVRKAKQNKKPKTPSLICPNSQSEQNLTLEYLAGM